MLTAATAADACQSPPSEEEHLSRAGRQAQATLHAATQDRRADHAGRQLHEPHAHRAGMTAEPDQELGLDCELVGSAHAATAGSDFGDVQLLHVGTKAEHHLLDEHGAPPSGKAYVIRMAIFQQLAGKLMVKASVASDSSVDILEHFCSLINDLKSDLQQMMS